MFFRKAIVVCCIMFCLLFFCQCVHIDKWHEEKYVLEGGGYFLNNKNVPEEKEYFVAGEKIGINILLQSSDMKPGFVFSREAGGPYKISIVFSPGKNNEMKKIFIHSLHIESDLGREFDLSELETLPREVQPEPFYHTDNIKKLEKENPGYKVSYTYLIEKEFDFDFEQQEVVYITVDVEVQKNDQNKREKVTLKIIPLLDKGSKLRIAGDGV